MFPLVAINHEQIKGSTTGGYSGKKIKLPNNFRVLDEIK